MRDAALNFKKGNILEEWEVSFEKKVPLYVGLYQTAEQYDAEYIHYGESLWLFHLETSSFLKMHNPEAQMESFFFRKISKFWFTQKLLSIFKASKSTMIARKPTKST